MEGLHPTTTGPPRSPTHARVRRAVIDDPEPPTALSALAAEVVEDYRRRGLSRLIIESMAAVGRCARLTPLVAPVRPSWKDRYPLTSIDRYARWVRGDGLPVDP
jgi:hypothetical protein